MKSSLWQEFKAFAFKGNMIELAVAVVIGAAFGAVVNALVKDIVMPMISYVMPQGLAYTDWTLGTKEKPIFIGKFLGEVVNFLVIAFSVFILMVKVVGMMSKLAAAPPPVEEPTIKECPLCLSVIPIKARKSAHCTADL